MGSHRVGHNWSYLPAATSLENFVFKGVYSFHLNCQTYLCQVITFRILIRPTTVLCLFLILTTWLSRSPSLCVPLFLSFFQLDQAHLWLSILLLKTTLHFVFFHSAFAFYFTYFYFYFYYFIQTIFLFLICCSFFYLLEMETLILIISPVLSNIRG